jgi:hypothetical protein
MKKLTNKELKIAESCETFKFFIIGTDIPWKYQSQISAIIKQAFIEGMRYQKIQDEEIVFKPITRKTKGKSIGNALNKMWIDEVENIT